MHGRMFILSYFHSGVPVVRFSFAVYKLLPALGKRRQNATGHDRWGGRSRFLGGTSAGTTAGHSAWLQQRLLCGVRFFQLHNAVADDVDAEADAAALRTAASSGKQQQRATRTAYHATTLIGIRPPLRWKKRFGNGLLYQKHVARTQAFGGVSGSKFCTTTTRAGRTAAAARRRKLLQTPPPAADNPMCERERVVKRGGGSAEEGGEEVR